MAIPKHFKLVKEHSDSYEIQDSRDKKNFHIAKKGLDLDMHAKLSKIQRLSNGGEAEETLGSKIGYPGVPNPPKPKNFDDGGLAQQSSVQDSPEQILADAGTSNSSAAPSPVAPVQSTAPNTGEIYQSVYDQQKKLNPGAPDEMIRNSAYAVAEQAKNASEAKTQYAAMDAQDAASKQQAENQKRASLGLAPLDGTQVAMRPDMNLNPTSGNSPVPGDGAPSAGAQTVDPYQAQSASQAGGFQEQKDANSALAKAEGDQGDSEAKQIGDANQQAEKLPSQQDIINQYKAKDSELMSKIASSQIDPNRFWNNKSTGSKIAAGIGMLISGIGSGVSGQPNMAVEAIHQAIERDIDSQKNDQSKNTNLWKMNREAMGSDLAANLATQNQIYTGLKYNLMKTASQAASPIAKARAQSANAVIDQQIAQNHFKLSLMNPCVIQGAAQGSEAGYVNHLNGLQVVAPELYKEEEAKYIPGIGRARIPVKPEDVDALKGYGNLSSAIQDAKNFQDTTGTTFPMSTNNALAEQKRNAIILQLREMSKKRPDENVWQTFEKDVPTIGAFRGAKTDAILDEMDKAAQSYKSSHMNSLGVTPFAKAPNDSMAIAWAKNNLTGPKSAQASQILKMNGIQ